MGTIPTEILGIKHLTDFELNFNYLAGTIPPELFNSDDLILINLGGNSFTGSLPSEIGRVSVLQRLLLYSNQLSGSLPIELFQLESLSKFCAGGCAVWIFDLIILFQQSDSQFSVVNGIVVVRLLGSK